MQRLEDEIKFCKYCGKRMARRRNKNGKLESNLHFRRRIYCNRECMRRGFLQADSHTQNWSNTHTTARKVNKLLNGDSNCCSICGKVGKVDVHHIDFNEQNNDKNNLATVCRSCHMKIHRKKPICKVPGCEEKVKGYGYCNKHYCRYKKYGDPLLTNIGHGHIVRVEI